MSVLKIVVIHNVGTQNCGYFYNVWILLRDCWSAKLRVCKIVGTKSVCVFKFVGSQKCWEYSPVKNGGYSKFVCTQICE